MHIEAVILHLENTLIQTGNRTDKANPAPGAEAVVRYCEDKGLRLAIVSHESHASVQKILDQLPFIRQSDLCVVCGLADHTARSSISDPVQLAAAKMKLPLDRVLAVAGDSAFLHDAPETRGNYRAN